MNDYFDALLRATGVALDNVGTASASIEPPPLLDQSLEVVVQEVQSERQPLARAPRTGPGPSPSRGIPVVNQVVERLAPADETAEVSAAVGEATKTKMSDSAPPAVIAARPVPSLEAAADRLTNQATAPPTGPERQVLPLPSPPVISPETGEVMLSTAIRWIAADPNRSAPPPQPFAEARRPTLSHRARFPTVEESLAAFTAAEGAPATDEAGQPSRLRDPVPSRTVGPPAPAVVEARAVEPVAPAPAVVTRSRDELVEVSIGAISIRVDPPSASTPTIAAPPRRAARPGLSRRLLRRI